MELDLKTVVPCCSGPKRPQDKVAVSDMKKDFESCLGAKVNAWGGNPPQPDLPHAPLFIFSAQASFCPTQCCLFLKPSNVCVPSLS